jgi:hypothetical protein
LEGALHMLPNQLILLQEAYKALKETNQCESHPMVEKKIDEAMDNIRKALQIQGVFMS